MVFIKGNVGYWTGKKRGSPSLEWRKKLSKSLKGRKKTLEHRLNISKKRCGEDNPAWTGGRYKVSSGHVIVFQPEHPFCNSNNKVYEHRLVMEKKLGRYLTKDESIHHIDGNPGNNNINNLFLTDRGGNIKAHHSFSKLLKSLLDDKIIVFNKERGIYERK